MKVELESKKSSGLGLAILIALGLWLWSRQAMAAGILQPTKAGFLTDPELYELWEAGVIPPIPKELMEGAIAAVYPPQQPYWTGTKWVLRSPRT